MTPTCRYCGCTESNACKLPDGDACAWFNATRTVCTNPACIRAAFATKGKQELEAKKARPRKRTPAEIHRLIKEERNAKRRARRKGNAA